MNQFWDIGVLDLKCHFYNIQNLIRMKRVLLSLLVFLTYPVWSQNLEENKIIKIETVNSCIIQKEYSRNSPVRGLISPVFALWAELRLPELCVGRQKQGCGIYLSSKGWAKQHDKTERPWSCKKIQVERAQSGKWTEIFVRPG